MSFWEYANPKKFMETSSWALPWVTGLAVLALLAGLVWGFFFTPDDFRQGSTVKIIYVHVPSAMMAINAWAMMLVTSLIWLVRRHHVSVLAAKAAAPIGMTMTLIALFTGAIWGQPMWGTWWAWDARLTSFLILFFLYLGYIALANAFDDATRGNRAAAILALVGAVNLPIIKYSVDWWNTLHQPASVMRTDGPSIDPAMLVPLFLMALGFTAYYVAVLLVRVKAELIGARLRNAQLLRAQG